jgi:2-oxoglutarate ferredoxin oxidoreductase subunit beta
MAVQRIISRPRALIDKATPYCPGCLHGVVTRIIAEVIDELDVIDSTVAVLPVGCGTMNMHLFNTEIIVSPHGRAPAVATGVKRCSPEKMVFTYQGDGDLAAIGLAEIMHCANRGENITVIFVNNGTYGMTGGQMAPTTLVGQESTTSPGGRSPATEGYPMKMCEIINQLQAPKYIARFSLDTPSGVIKAKRGISKAMKLQLGQGGFSFIELLSNCPTGWKMLPVQSLSWLKENMAQEFPPGVFRDKEVQA